MTRTFQDKPAIRSQVPVLIALFGPSGGGKTYSALRLATGIKRVVGGDILVIDTEARRALHYADRFDFRHMEFVAPFSPVDYLDAIEHAVSRGVKTIVIDSMSHEHEGPGGVLEMHEAELERMCGNDYKKRQRMTMLGWAKPKGQRRRLINSVTQLGVNVIMCFRAKRKLKMVTGREPEELGWMPIGGDEFLYEMTAAALLPPGVDGVPDWNPQLEGERAMVKLPEQFRDVLPGQQLTEDVGEAMARWASGVPEVWTFPKGEHKGATMGEVPVEYLTRLLDSDDVPDGPLRTMAETEMEVRVTAQADAAESETE